MRLVNKVCYAKASTMTVSLFRQNFGMREAVLVKVCGFCFAPCVIGIYESHGDLGGQWVAFGYKRSSLHEQEKTILS